MAGLLHEKNVEIPEISTSLNSFDFQFFKGVPVKKKKLKQITLLT